MNHLETKELTQPVRLCDDNGNLNEASAGWSRYPLHTCNLKGHWSRKKKWNYWCITGSKYIYSITISDVDYLGLIFVYYLDIETGEYAEDTLVVPFGAGVAMGEQVSDTAAYRSKNVHVKFSYSENTILLSTLWKNFHGKTLESEIKITVPANHETLSVVVPWSASRFQYTSKQHCLPAEGYFKTGDKKYHISSADSFACLDFGRGIWPYSINWNWGAFSARISGHTVGFNGGGQWTDKTGISENSVCIDGKLFKIQEPLKWEYDNRDFMKPWKIKSTLTDIVDLTFTPFFDRVAKINLLVLKSEANQCFGKYSGTITKGGTALNIENVIGWAEEHVAKW